MPTSRDVRRGDVCSIDLSRHGGRLQKVRPVLVVQNDVANRVSSETIVAAIRDPHGGRSLPVFVHVAHGTGGLKKASIIDAGHLNTVGKDMLAGPIGSMPPDVMARVDAALRVSLSV